MTKPDPTIPLTSDPLAETLHMLRLTGTLYCRGELTAPWAIAIPQLEGVMIFLVVTSGSCWLQLEGKEPRLLSQGCLALIPHGLPHTISSAAGLEGDTRCLTCRWKKSASATKSCAMAAAAS